jgi:hypothetical protein
MWLAAQAPRWRPGSPPFPCPCRIYTLAAHRAQSPNCRNQTAVTAITFHGLGLHLLRRQAAPPGDGAAGGRRLAVASWLGEDVFEQGRPADQRVAAVADTRLDGQVQVVGFAGQARHLGGGLGDVQDQHAPAPDEGCAPQPSEGQIPILPGLMQGPIPAGLALVMEIVLDSPTTRAPKPGKHSSDPAEHGRLPLLCPCQPLSSVPNPSTRRPAALVWSVRSRPSALGPYRIGNLRIRAGRSGHDRYQGIADRRIFLP